MRRQTPRTVPVRETFSGQTIWEGEVEIFWLTGHPTVKRCFAWLQHEANEDRVVTVLEIPPVIGPATAVRNALTSAEERSEPLSH